MQHYGGKEKRNGETLYINPVEKVTFFNPKDEATLEEVGFEGCMQRNGWEVKY